MEFPLFFRKEDALSSYDRLQETKRSSSDELDVKNVVAPVPDVQETSLLDIITLFQGGGFEGRPLEFYPGIDDIEKAKTLMGF